MCVRMLRKARRSCIRRKVAGFLSRVLIIDHKRQLLKYKELEGMGFLYPSTCRYAFCLLYSTDFFTSYICKTHFNVFSVSESQDEKRRNKFCLLETILSHFLFFFFLPKLCKQMLLQVIFSELILKEIKKPLKIFLTLALFSKPAMLASFLQIFAKLLFELVNLFYFFCTKLCACAAIHMNKILKAIFGAAGKIRKWLLTEWTSFLQIQNLLIMFSNPLKNSCLINYR